MKRLIVAVAFIMTSMTVFSQSQVEAMLRDAAVFNNAYMQKDFTKYVDMMVPSVVEVAGGSAIMVDNVKETYKLTSGGGVVIESIEPSKPGKIMLAEEELHALIPQKSINKIGTTKFEKTSYFLAVSDDDGKSWKFLDLEPYDAESLKTFVPSFTGEIEIPEVAQPILIED